MSGIVKSQNTGGGTLPAAPAITTTTLAAATMGKEYRQQITATGGTPITWSYSGTLPDGMTLAANTGILSGHAHAGRLLPLRREGDELHRLLHAADDARRRRQ